MSLNLLIMLTVLYYILSNGHKVTYRSLTRMNR